MGFIDRLALALLIVGGINWGSVGLFQFDFVSWICGGTDSIITRIIFTLVGISAVWCISILFRDTEAEEHVSINRQASM